MQWHATIIDASGATNNVVGNMVHAIFKIEQETLTLAAVDISEKPSAESFESPLKRAIVRKVELPKGDGDARRRNVPSLLKHNNDKGGVEGQQHRAAPPGN